MIKQVNKILGVMESGATEPLSGIIDSDRVIIKVFKNRFSTKVLVNEFVCLEIAKILDLPIPDGGICEINQCTDIENLIDYEKCLEDVEGIGFYSRKIDKVIELVDIEEGIKNKLDNKKDIVKIILFDYFVYNKDRHDGNVLIDISPKNNVFKMHIIDHSHVFNMGGDWTIIEEGVFGNTNIIEKNREVYSNFIEEININTLKDEAQNFREKLNKDEFKKILDKVPNEWVNNKNKDNILKYLMHRLDNIESLCYSICKDLESLGGELNENSLFDINI